MTRSSISARGIFRFTATAIVFYAIIFFVWLYCLPAYISIITSLANEELHLFRVDQITSMGVSTDSRYDIAVYHRDAAGTNDSLFDFKIESIRSMIPVFLALILAMPTSRFRKLKAAVFGLIFITFIESSACVLIMTWSYIFLPDHHIFSPFTQSTIRDSIVGFLYDFYNSVGVGFFPILIWVIVSIREEEVHRIFKGAM